MKKLFILLISVFVFSVTACSDIQYESYLEAENHENAVTFVEGDSFNDSSVIQEIMFAYVASDEFMLGDVASLAEFADHVFIGEVERISFAVINDETGKIPTDECNPNHLTLVTIYDVAVLSSYKGAQQRTIRVITPGGVRGYRETEQLATVAEARMTSIDGVYRIPIHSYASHLEVGRVYIFSVIDLIIELDGYSNFVGQINSRQSFLELDNPRNLIDNYTDISVESLIREFGETAFDEFMQNWESFQNR